MTNNLQVIMVDHNTGRLIDYVQLMGPNSVRDLTAEILNGYDTVGSGNNTGYNDLWDTNLMLAAIVVLLAVEWILRKEYNMA